MRDSIWKLLGVGGLLFATCSGAGGGGGTAWCCCLLLCSISVRTWSRMSSLTRFYLSLSLFSLSLSLSLSISPSLSPSLSYYFALSAYRSVIYRARVGLVKWSATPPLCPPAACLSQFPYLGTGPPVAARTSVGRVFVLGISGKRLDLNTLVGDGYCGRIAKYLYYKLKMNVVEVVVVRSAVSKRQKQDHDLAITPPRDRGMGREIKSRREREREIEKRVSYNK
eukprot:sb/3469686/